MHAPRDHREALLTQDGVEQFIRDLYNLKHFGKSLRGLRDGITHYKDYDKQSYHRRRSRSRRSRSTETREDVSGRSSRSNDGVRNRDGTGELFEDSINFCPIFRSIGDNTVS